SWTRGKDRAFVAVAREQRQAANVVQVAVSNHHAVELVDVAFAAILSAQLFAALKEAAVNEYAGVVRGYVIRGFGTGAHCSKKTYLHFSLTLPYCEIKGL